jgi:hypothetical protein
MIQKPPLQKIKIPKPCNQKHAPFAEPEFLSPANRIDTRRTSGFRESEVSQVFLGCGCRINKALTTALDLRRAFCTLRQRNTGSQDGPQAMMRRCGLNLLQGCLHSSHKDLKAARRRFSHANHIYLDRRVIK